MHSVQKFQFQNKMTKSFLLIASFILVCNLAFAQHPAVFQPGYNPTVPRLIMMRHKALSKLDEFKDVTTKDFNNKINKENINIYFVYEKDPAIGTKRGNDSELFNPPAKLMDLYIIYEYNYRIHIHELDSLEKLMPIISLESDNTLHELKSTAYYVKDYKLKTIKIKNQDIKPDLANNELKFSLNKTTLPENSIIELKILIKSKNFGELKPSINSAGTYERKLIIGIPDIFDYDVKYGDLSTHKEGKFTLLHFLRDSGIGNGRINEFNVGFKSYMSENTDIISKTFPLILNKFNFPVESDIGITPEYLVLISN